jgi:hypothetical protein
MGIFLANNTDPLLRRRGIENVAADGSTPFKWDREGAPVQYSLQGLKVLKGTIAVQQI